MNNNILKKDDELYNGLLWFIKLRWLAICGVLITIFVAGKIFDIKIFLKGILNVCLFLIIYNIIFYVILKVIDKFILKEKQFYYNIIANLQIILDLLALTIILHFSGGIENPFVFYYIFHIILSSILLSPVAAFGQTTFASLLFLSMALLEYFKYIPHYNLENFLPINFYNDKIFIIAYLFALISTFYLAAYMAIIVSIKLRKREKQLEESNLLLEEKDKIKSEYILRVSHDIKEHLAAIQGCIEPVQTKLIGSLNEKQVDLLTRAIERTNKLLFFVKALLEVTRFRLNNKIKFECFDIREVINDAIVSVKEKAVNKNISINVNFDYNLTNIIGAKMEIQETIVNLIMNSIKYTYENGKIDITARENKDNTILISISDNGIGIPKAELSMIFQEFFRASNARKIERTGTGLGLVLAKEVVEQHKGKIWLESEENKGTTVYINLPKFQQIQ